MQANLLQAASRVEAAVEAYKSVREFSDKEVWVKFLKEELTTAVQEFFRVRAANPQESLHPTLAALSIVLDENDDIENISRLHPKLGEHSYYDDRAEFPPDISHLLPPNEERWWDNLAEVARAEHAAKTATPPAPPPRTSIRSIRLIVPDPKAQPENSGEEEPMVVDEGPAASAEPVPRAPRGRGRPRLNRGAASTRKRKGSLGASRGTSKRHASSRQRPDPAGQHSGNDDGNPVEKSSGNDDGEDTYEQGLEDAKASFTCEKCEVAGVVCDVMPIGPCSQCAFKKCGCSLMPQNPKTGKTDRHLFTADEILEFRIRKFAPHFLPRFLASGSRLKKGKQRAHDSPDAADSEGSAPFPSPLAQLGKLTLSGSSAANTPDDSPATLSQLPLPGRPTVRQPPKPSAGVTLDSPGTSRLLEPVPQHSPGNASPTSGGGSDEIAVLRRRVEILERALDESVAKLNFRVDWLERTQGASKKRGQ